MGCGGRNIHVCAHTYTRAYVQVCPGQGGFFSTWILRTTFVPGSPTKGYSVPLGGARVIKVSGNNKIGHKRRLEARLPVSHFLLPCLPSPQPLLSQEKPVRNPLAFRQSWSNYYLWFHIFPCPHFSIPTPCKNNIYQGLSICQSLCKYFNFFWGGNLMLINILGNVKDCLLLRRRKQRSFISEKGIPKMIWLVSWDSISNLLPEDPCLLLISPYKDIS